MDPKYQEPNRHHKIQKKPGVKGSETSGPDKTRPGIDPKNYKYLVRSKFPGPKGSRPDNI